jgi:4a-hydroxytetrahydrobiopterin dehydratase
MKTELAQKRCTACESGTPPLAGDDLRRYQQQLEDGWSVVDGHHLTKEYSFKNFRDALAFTNRIGDIAEAENHHPDITLTWGKVALKIWTHKVDGLTESDFVLAAKADEAR